MTSSKQLDKRDRRLLHAVRVKAEDALFLARQGHNNGWQPLRDALDKCEDEMGAIEDFVI